MQSLTFVFEATLLAPLVEFATSSSGHVEPRWGLALGWLGSVVAGLAVVFGVADRAQADSCYGIAEGSIKKVKPTFADALAGVRKQIWATFATTQSQETKKQPSMQQSPVHATKR